MADVSALHPVSRFLALIGEALVSFGEGQARIRQVDALQALSDAELAQRGIRRQDIARLVFADSVWL
jgi:uncharacterized protein YjiS (DUF1127 family)